MTSPSDIVASAPVKLAAYAVVLALMVGGGAAVGSAAGPIDVSGSDREDHGGTAAQAGDASMPATGAVVDAPGYRVMLDGQPMVGEAELGFTVDRDGPVTPTGAWHLVAIRARDLAPVDVRPLDGGRFAVSFPDPGMYRLVLDFDDRGETHTAAFMVDVGENGARA